MHYSFRFEAIKQEPFEEKALQDIADNDPVGLLKKCRRQGRDLREGTRRSKWRLWVASYAGAQGIRRRPDLFPTLLEDDYFKQRTYKPDLDDLLRIGLLIGTDADAEGLTYKNACYAASRLQPLFDADVEPMEVLKRIEAARGLKRLDVSDVVVASDQSDDGDQHDGDVEDDDEEVVGSGDVADAEDDGDGEDAEPDDDDDEGGDDEDDGSDADEEPAGSPATARSPAQSGASGRRKMSRVPELRGGLTRAKKVKAQPKPAAETSDHVTREARDGMFILEVEVTQEMLDKVLSAACSMLFVEHAGSEGGWQRIVGVTVASSD